MVNMEDGISFGVMAVIGIVAVAVVLGLTNSITTLSTVNNETLDFGTGSVNGTAKALAHNSLDGTALVLKWQNGTYNSVTLNTPQNYTLSASGGTITLNSTAATGNITAASRYWNASYQYQPTGYVTGSNATLVNNYSVLMLVGVLAFVGVVVATKFGGLYK